MDKTKIKTNFLYQHTLLNIPNDGGLNCASDGIKIHIGGTDSLKQVHVCFCGVFGTVQFLIIVGMKLNTEIENYYRYNSNLNSIKTLRLFKGYSKVSRDLTP